MSFSFSSPQVSPGPDPNQLYDAAKVAQAGQAYQSNQLHMQGQQMDLSNANQAQVNQAAAGLLSAYPDEASRAAAYPRVIGMLQSQGFALHAPSEYPGEGVLRSMVNQSIPAKDLYSSGALMTPAQQALLGGGNTGTTTSTTGTGTAGSAPPAGGASFAGGIAGFESGGTSNPPENSRWPIAKGGPAGPHQFIASTWNQFAQANPDLFKGMTPDQILAARTDTTPVGPNGEDRSTLATNWYAGQNAQVLQANNIPPTPANLGIAHALGAGGATKVLSAPDNTPLSQVIPETIPQNPQYGRMTVGDLKRQYSRLGPVGGGTAVAATPPAGGGGTPGSYQVASTAPVPPPGSTAAPGGPPADPQFTYPNGKVGGAPDAQGGVHYADGNYGTPPPGPRVPVAAAAPTPAQPGQPTQPQPAPAPAAQPAPAAAPASTSRLPEASTIPTGQNSAPYKQAMQLQQQAMQYDAVGGTNPAFAKHAADLRLQAAGILQAGATVSAQQDGRPGTLEVVTGKFTPYTPLPSPRLAGGTSGVFNAATGQYERPTPATQANAVPGTWSVTGDGTQQFFPEGSVPAHANYDIALEDLKKDRGEIASIGDAGRAAQNDNLRVQEMRDILTNANTGPGTETAARLRAWVARWTPGELSKWDGSGANLSNPAAIEMFQKLGFVGAVTQERGSTPRGGYQATKLFQQFNPGAQLLTSTNQGLLAQRLIANQAEEDYAQGAQDHYNTQRQRLKSPERDYEPISSFDAKWQAQRNPQVYAAAIGALGGQDPEMWSRGLNKDEIQRVKDVVTRADPSAVIHMPGEGKVVLQPNGKPVPSGFKVQ